MGKLKMKDENKEITSNDVIFQIESGLEDYELDNSQRLMVLELWKLKLLEEEQDKEYNLDDDDDAEEDTEEEDQTALNFNKLDRQLSKHKGQEFEDDVDAEEDIEASEDEFDHYEDLNDELEKNPPKPKPVIKRKIMGRPPIRRNSVPLRKP